MRYLILIALFIASCTKQPQPTTVYGVWGDADYTVTITPNRLQWSSNAPYTSFAATVRHDTLMWVMSDGYTAPMYTFTVSSDRLVLHSLTIGTPTPYILQKVK